MADQKFMLAMEVAGRDMGNEVALGGVVEDRIGSAEGLQRAIGTTRKRLHARIRNERSSELASEYLLIRIGMNVTKS